MDSLIKKLKGPIAVLGAKGFIGHNLLTYLNKHRADVYAGTRENLWSMLDDRKPQTVFNCIGFGLRKGEISAPMMNHTNFSLTGAVLDTLILNGFDSYIHAGSSVEYGRDLAWTAENAKLKPATPYALSKAAASMMIRYYGRELGHRVANLRLYNVYGPGESENSFVSVVIREGRKNKLPEFGPKDLTRDFIHVDDVCRAFVYAAVNLTPDRYGQSFNVGTGIYTTLAEVAMVAKKVFRIKELPKFTRPAGMNEPKGVWCASTGKANRCLGFAAKIGFEEGFTKMAGEVRG